MTSECHSENAIRAENGGWSLGGVLGTSSATRVIQRIEDLEELAGAWDWLAARSDSPMQHYAWGKACAATFTEDTRLQVVAVGAPQAAAIAPLVRGSGVLGRMELLGLGGLNEPTDFLFADPAALAALTDALARLGVPLSLRRLPADSPVVAALRHSYRWRGIVTCRPRVGTAWIPLDAGWREPERHLNSGRRSDLRRARKIAEQIGPVTCEVVSPTPSTLEPLLEEAFQVEAAGWKGRQGSAMAKDDLRGAFFRRYAAGACQQGVLRLCFLRIGGRSAAMQLAVESGQRFWLLKIGYDDAFARCSPGLLLMMETIRYAATRGISSYEFLGTVEPWTVIWTRLERPCTCVQAYPMSFRGIAALTADAARIAWGRLAWVVQGRRRTG